MEAKPGEDAARSGEHSFTEADETFFKSMIRRDVMKQRKPELRDFDVYLMETSVMPLLLQGLDALARHVDQMGHSSRQDPEARARFNPRIWLAQYILRNHPGHVRAGDEKEDAPKYAMFTEWASIEKGRRELVSRRPQVENTWRSMERKTQGQVLNVNHMPTFVASLDDAWNLQGALVNKLPKHFMEALNKNSGTDSVTFQEFWDYFEKLFESTDLLRVEDFERGAQLKKEQDFRLAQEAEERERKEQLARARQERRQALVAQFEEVKAHLVMDPEVGKILRNGAAFSGVEDEENAVKLAGEHVTYIKQLIRLWGVEVPGGTSGTAWNDGALAAWKSWAKRHSPEGEAALLDAGNMEILMSLEAYTEFFLAKTFPTEAEAALPGGQTERALGLRRVEARGVEYVAQVIDDETGHVIEVFIPDEIAEEVQRRMATERGAIMVSVNVEDGCVGKLL